MDELTETLQRIIDDTQLPARPPVARLKQRTRRRIQRNVLGSSVVVVALILGVVFGLMPGHVPVNRGFSPATELTAFKAGRAAFAQAGGPPIYSYGVIGPAQLWVLSGDGLFISTDGASTFRQITPPIGGSPLGFIHAVAFTSASDGWVLRVEHEGGPLSIARTTNGGTTWSQVALPSLRLRSFGTMSMDFINDRVGRIAIGGWAPNGETAPGVLLATVDGGSTWTIVNATSPVGVIAFTGTKTGWGLDRVQGANTLYRTEDGGTIWSAVALGSPVSGDPVSWALPTFFGDRGVMVGRSLGWGFGHPVIGVTSDNGNHWHFQRAPFGQPGGCAAQVCSADLPFAAANATDWFSWSGFRLYRTDDGGKSWTERPPNIAFPQSGQQIVGFVTAPTYSSPGWPIVFTSPTSGWAIVSSGSVSLILATDDGGRHFRAYSPPSGAP